MKVNETISIMGVAQEDFEEIDLNPTKDRVGLVIRNTSPVGAGYLCVKLQVAQFPWPEGHRTIGPGDGLHTDRCSCLKIKGTKPGVTFRILKTLMKKG